MAKAIEAIQNGTVGLNLKIEGLPTISCAMQNSSTPSKAIGRCLCFLRDYGK